MKILNYDYYYYYYQFIYRKRGDYEPVESKKINSGNVVTNCAKHVVTARKETYVQNILIADIHVSI